jgi:hypothetical protein
MATATQNLVTDQKREFLRHALATIAYRGGKAIRGASASFADFHAAETTRTPGQILAHIGDLMDWALSMAQGKEVWHDSKPLPWDQEVQRFHAALQKLDEYFSSQPIAVTPEKLFQGAIADSLWHTGQIAMLRGMAGCKIKAENYSRAEIVAGRVGAEQAAPKREFD